MLPGKKVSLQRRKTPNGEDLRRITLGRIGEGHISSLKRIRDTPKDYALGDMLSRKEFGASTFREGIKGVQKAALRTCFASFPEKNRLFEKRKSRETYGRRAINALAKKRGENEKKEIHSLWGSSK